MVLLIAESIRGELVSHICLWNQEKPGEVNTLLHLSVDMMIKRIVQSRLHLVCCGKENQTIDANAKWGRVIHCLTNPPSKSAINYFIVHSQWKETVREDTPSLTTWSPLQSWSAWIHKKNWSQGKKREGILLLSKPSLKVSNSVLKLFNPSQSQLDWKEYQTFVSDAHC